MTTTTASPKTKSPHGKNANTRSGKTIARAGENSILADADAGGPPVSNANDNTSEQENQTLTTTKFLDALSAMGRRLIKDLKIMALFLLGLAIILGTMSLFPPQTAIGQNTTNLTTNLTIIYPPGASNATIYKTCVHICENKFPYT